MRQTNIRPAVNNESVALRSGFGGEGKEAGCSREGPRPCSRNLSLKESQSTGPGGAMKKSEVVWWGGEKATERHYVSTGQRQGLKRVWVQVVQKRFVEKDERSQNRRSEWHKWARVQDTTKGVMGICPDGSSTGKNGPLKGICTDSC